MNALWREIEPRAYGRVVEPAALVRAFMSAFVLYLPGLRAVAERGRKTLRTIHASTLSYALRRASSLRWVQALIQDLEAWHRPSAGSVVALDSMAVSLPATRRHGCAKMNNATVGGGVLWGFWIDAPAGANPIRIFNLMEGAWHDTQTLAAEALEPRGPLYLMDRGFWALEAVGRWVELGVNFIARARGRDFQFEPIRTRGPARLIAKTWVSFDGVARLGSPKRRGARPVVRLIVARLETGEDLILAASQMRWSAERILATYKQRWQIERFHKFLKEALGLAHLYSFQHSGMMFLLHVAALLAILLFMAQSQLCKDRIETLREALKTLRAKLGLSAMAWRPNTRAGRRTNTKSRPTRHPPPNGKNH